MGCAPLDPRGLDVPIGPHRVLHADDTGPVPGGGPTVVLEAGAASTRSIWALVQQEFAGTVRTISYDRAGLGRSPGAPGSRRLEDLARDLNALLDGLEEAEHSTAAHGVVLVGHSWGGPIVRAAALQRPERVRALVLVDPADELCSYYLSPGFARLNALQAVLFPPLARLGALGPMYARSVPMLPERARSDSRTEMYTPQAVRTQLAESADMAGDLRLLGAADDAAGDQGFPVTVISGASASGVGRSVRAQMSEAHRERAGRTAGGRLVVAQDSGHLVMLTEPRVVSGEILRTLGR
ncbi:alpha/beta hydrolase [Brachybacterium halotolerans subsp. kimchii]|uniref:alpha/beta fold hydrolase n=1 Tax=Brachybacterium halotolerans TaxID=2795215 RepID=UPI001E5E6595|nr:alpha/beta hydrolase [Brachybacterium halotolerans]UEJ82840.1 alpha/beta hydrolase [Brachybacterium halotolerans subsp. kimchii]